MAHDDLTLYEELIHLQRLGVPLALATVVETSGSTPRKSGAKLLLRGDGSTLGSIGGGMVEAQVIARAKEALSDGKSSLLTFPMTEQYGHVCGGTMRIFVEPISPQPRLLIVGTGHVGQAVALLAETSGFSVTALPESSTEGLLSALPSDTAFAVVATASHEQDFAAVCQLLSTSLPYIGLLGSRRKRAELHRHLQQKGIPEEAWERVKVPVGLDIGAETPVEIAVSIVAQLIAERRTHGTSGVCCHTGSREIHADGAGQTPPPPG
jgi:xanthine dehydrogenase accessory factor